MKRVLFLEDHLFFAQALSPTLGDTVEAVLATTLAEGREALRKRAKPFDLAVVDLELPDGNGSEILPELKERMPGAPGAAILSAREDFEEVAQATGADEAIRKGSPCRGRRMRERRLGARSFS